MTQPAGPWVGWVDNGEDLPATVGYLRDLDTYRRNRYARIDFVPVVVRPTPGGGDRTAIGFDLLTALGKSPDVIGQERIRGHDLWNSARAWLIGSGTTDLVIDRAHALGESMLAALVDASPRPRSHRRGRHCRQRTSPPSAPRAAATSAAPRSPASTTSTAPPETAPTSGWPTCTTCTATPCHCHHP